MIVRAGHARPRLVAVLLLCALCLLPACGRKAKPQPLWGASPLFAILQPDEVFR